MGTSAEDTRRPARWWLAGWPLLVLALIGLAAAAYLTVLHWQVHNQPGHVSFCAVSEGVNCDTVARSPYSWFLGVPVAMWVTIFYLVFTGLLLQGRLGRHSPWPYLLLVFMQALALGFTTYLALASHLLIHSLCLMCLTCYLVNSALALLACLVLGRSAGAVLGWAAAAVLLVGVVAGTIAFGLAHREFFARGELLAVGGGGALLLAVALARAGRTGLALLPTELGRQLRRLLAPAWAGIAWAAAILVLAAVAWIASSRLYPDSEPTIAGGTAGLATGHTTDGHPWIGAAAPQVVIKEYSDYECPFCRRAHKVVRQLVRENRDWLRLVHVHVPLDHKCNPLVRRPFHRHACRCARAAICADEQGAFWPMNDLLYAVRCNLNDTSPERLAEELGLDLRLFSACLEAQDTHRRLEIDLTECQQVARECREAGRGFGTPTFVVGNEVISGAKSPEFWRQMLERLRRQGSQSEAAY